MYHKIIKRSRNIKVLPTTNYKLLLIIIECISEKPVIENVYDSRILLAINTRECIVKEIASTTKSQKLAVRRQIKRDLLKNYLNEKILDDGGKTIYSIKWKRITSDFLDYLKKLIKEKDFSRNEIKKIISYFYHLLSSQNRDIEGI